MKKVLSIIIIIMCTSLFSGCASNLNNSNSREVFNYDDVKDSLIRFHVIANSDDEEDQELKLKVKDEVIEYLYPYLEKSTSLEESRKILVSHEEDVNNIASQVISDAGYKYDVKIQFSRENFPEKNYGDIVLPQGEYEAFRIIIGNGEGKNWWCVMFPPLCFVDVTKGTVSDSESKEKINKTIEEQKTKEEKEEEVVVKSKIVEVFKKYIK